MGDAHMSSSELAFNFDGQQFHRSFLTSIRDDQIRGCQHNPATDRDAPCGNVAMNNGSVPDVTPYTTGPYGELCLSSALDAPVAALLIPALSLQARTPARPAGRAPS